jgi:hypothetical protein
MITKEEYYRYLEEKDTYPSHSHNWIVRTYIDSYDGAIEEFYRNFGPFNTKKEATEFISNYKTKYTTKGFITSYNIQPLCSIVMNT